MGKFFDLTGKRFGRLVAIEIAGRTKSGNILWKCKCDCGNEKIVSNSNLTSKHTQSCGCYKTERDIEYHTKHGQRNTRIYSIWGKVKARCYNSACSQYKFYGARGIKVCDEWQGDKGFEKFYEWAMSHGYNDTLTIDRIDTNGDYEPLNCRWATWEQQQNNRRSNRVVTYNGKEYTTAELAREVGVPYKLFMGRLYRGFTIDEAVVGKRKK